LTKFVSGRTTKGSKPENLEYGLILAIVYLKSQLLIINF